MLLGVNIDHIAVLREARKINDPDPISSLNILKIAGANQVTIHLREDRRHIQDTDVENIIKLSHLPVNLECSIDEKIVEIACKLKPNRVTLVPEKREEVTTEGGLDLEKNFEKIEKAIKKFKSSEIEVSLFIDPDEKSIELSSELECEIVELHTGTFANIYAMLYSNLRHSNHSIKELEYSREKLELLLQNSIIKLRDSAILANSKSIKVAAGHGLNYQNVVEILKIPHLFELNIGQSIIARSIFVGLERAIIEMKELLK